MKIAWWGLLLVLLSGTGCVATDWMTMKKEEPPPPAPAPALPPRPREPLTAEQVTPSNAHKAANALWDELDSESAH